MPYRQATRVALLKNTSQSGFIARQVASYLEQLKPLTVPELKQLAQKHGLSCTGKKQHLLTRMAIWVRDEVASGVSHEDNNASSGAACAVESDTPGEEVIESVDDDSSTSSEELELFKRDDEVTSSSASDDVGKVAAVGDFQTIHSVEKRQTELTEGGEEELCLVECDDEDEVEHPALLKTDATCPLRSTLRDVFGHTDLRDGQEWLIQRCLDQKRSLLVAPTGFGKSLCYALPAALMEGVCIVVSPLLSLIQDQLRDMPPRIPAATLSGQMSTAAMAATLDDVVRGRLKILFVSPERLSSSSFRRMFRPKWNQETNKYERQFPTVSLLCVDEAHCLSQWAHNFRPSYLRIRSMMQMIQPEGVVAITATAGPRVVDDICQALEIRKTAAEDKSSESGVHVMTTNRDNIDVRCFVLSSQAERLNKVRGIHSYCIEVSRACSLTSWSYFVQLLKLLSAKPKGATNQESDPEGGCLSTGSVIVYVWRQRDAEAVAENIQAAGVAGGVVVYHGGMPSAARSRSQSRVSQVPLRTDSSLSVP